jgi:hypothetical protein
MYIYRLQDQKLECFIHISLRASRVDDGIFPRNRKSREQNRRHGATINRSFRPQKPSVNRFAFESPAFSYKCPNPLVPIDNSVIVQWSVPDTYLRYPQIFDD